MKIGFDNHKFRKSLAILDKLELSDKEINRAASKALISGVHEVRKGIQSFRGDQDGISISMLLSRMVRRRMSKKGYAPGARIIIDGPDIPMGDRDWSAQGVAKLFQKDDTGTRTTRSTGANRGEFEGRKVGGGDNYLARFAQQAEGKIKADFEQTGRKLMKDKLRKATNGR